MGIMWNVLRVLLVRMMITWVLWILWFWVFSSKNSSIYTILFVPSFTEICYVSFYLITYNMIKECC